MPHMFGDLQGLDASWDQPAARSARGLYQSCAVSIRFLSPPAGADRLGLNGFPGSRLGLPHFARSAAFAWGAGPHTASGRLLLVSQS